MRPFADIVEAQAEYDSSRSESEDEVDDASEECMALRTADTAALVACAPGCRVLLSIKTWQLLEMRKGVNWSMMLMPGEMLKTWFSPGTWRSWSGRAATPIGEGFEWARLKLGLLSNLPGWPFSGVPAAVVEKVSVSAMAARGGRGWSVDLRFLRLRSWLCGRPCSGIGEVSRRECLAAALRRAREQRRALIMGLSESESEGDITVARGLT